MDKALLNQYISEEVRRNYMATMEASRSHQNDPKVGIFWYDAASRTLFGIQSVEADVLQFSDAGPNASKTINTLHETYWNREHRRARDPLYSNPDYTQTPRGRVFEFRDGFKVKVGSWVNEVGADFIKRLVMEEFDLPDVGVSIDSHWDIGQGWGESCLD